MCRARAASLQFAVSRPRTARSARARHCCIQPSLAARRRQGHRGRLRRRHGDGDCAAATPQAGLSGVRVHTWARYDTRPVASWRHLRLGTWRLVVRAQLRRLACPEHGVRVEGVPFARPGSNMSTPTLIPGEPQVRPLRDSRGGPDPGQWWRPARPVDPGEAGVTTTPAWSTRSRPEREGPIDPPRSDALLWPVV